MEKSDHRTDQPVLSSCYMRQRNKEAGVSGEGGTRKEKAGPGPMAHFCHSGFWILHFGFYISNDEKPLDGSEQDKAQSDFYVEGSLWPL